MSDPTAAASQSDPAPAAAPEAAPAAAPPAPPAPPATAPAEPVNEPSLLETATATKTEPAPAADAPKTEEAPKPTEAAPAEAPKAETKPAAAEAPAAIEYAYELPETIKMDEGLREKFKDALDTLRGEGNSPQKLIDLHNEAMTTYAGELRQQQWDTFNGVRKDWRNSVMADEEIGGSGHQTAMGEIARVRDALLKPDEKDEFNKLLAGTGVGDHPLFLKMLYRARRFVNEGAMPPPGAKPAPNNGQAPKRSLKDLYR